MSALDRFDTDHIGTALRQLREEKGLSVTHVGEALKISPHYIAAIEELDTDALPSLGYVLGWLRSYAKFLGVNPAEAIARYKVDSAIPDDLGVSGSPHFVPERRIQLPKGAVAASAIAVSFAIIAIWYSGSSDAADQSTVVQNLPQNLAQAAPTEQLDPAIVTIIASRTSWVEIRDASGNIVISRIFVPGERYEIDRAPGLVMAVRDAGAVSISHMGENSGPLGPKGMPISAFALP